jgi:hypothetical protein
VWLLYEPTFRNNVLQLLVNASVVLCSRILFTPMMETIRSSETLVLKRTTLRHIPEDGLFYRSFVGLWPLKFLFLYTFGKTSLTGIIPK